MSVPWQSIYNWIVWIVMALIVLAFAVSAVGNLGNGGGGYEDPSQPQPCPQGAPGYC